ncbi:MAG: rhomboid family intramembrane serine protease, partial [Bacteroidales bacterium]|nr:rhomboid family intramembrane serine protease [Bacteroidales bacterium]
LNTLTPEQTQLVLSEGAEVFKSGKVYTDINMQALQVLLNTPTVGASGAIFGVLLAFGMLFPNTQLMLLIPPIPIKAKWFVLIYGVLELYLAISQPGSNVAHAAHLGGMLFGFIMIKYWQKRTNTLY